MSAPGLNPPSSADGFVQYVSPDRRQRASDRFDEAVRVAKLGGDHVWIVLVTHLIRDPASIGDDMLLDADSAVDANAGCYLCEQPYDPRLARRRCPGEPR